jgi:hypothetical protein
MGDPARPLSGHELLHWRQTRLIEGYSGRGIDVPDHVFGCSCGERGPVGVANYAMWFIAHLLTVLGADGGPNGLGRQIDDDEAQRLWFTSSR